MYCARTLQLLLNFAKVCQRTEKYLNMADILKIKWSLSLSKTYP